MKLIVFLNWLVIALLLSLLLGLIFGGQAL